jgi:hypothetical protein
MGKSAQFPVFYAQLISIFIPLINAPNAVPVEIGKIA